MCVSAAHQSAQLFAGYMPKIVRYKQQQTCWKVIINLTLLLHISCKYTVLRQYNCSKTNHNELNKCKTDIVWKVINYSLTNAIVPDPKCHIYVQYSTHTLSLLCGATYNDNYRRVNSCFSFAVDNIYVTFNVDDLKQKKWFNVPTS